MLVGLGTFTIGSHERVYAVGPIEPDVFQIGPTGWMPNNLRLPILLDRGAIAIVGDDPPSAFEAVFDRIGWPSAWRNGVYPFHHYHSTAHEVLGFAGGTARLALGEPGGHELTVRAGDVALLPAPERATAAWKRVRTFSSSEPIPLGQKPDLSRSAAPPQMLARIASLPFPPTDPVAGTGGPTRTLWHAA